MADSSEAARTGSTAASPLVGRRRELDVLLTALGRAIGGRGVLALVSGEAGIGKTSLVQVLAAEARRQGALVLTGAAFDLSVTPPYGPWLELRPVYHPTESALEPAFLFEDHEAIASYGGQEAIHEAAVDYLVRIAVDQSLVLILEDLHWSDRASLELLRFCARRIAGSSILLVATYRDDEITRDHPLYQLLPSLVRETGSERVELRPLDAPALTELATHLYDLDRSERDALVGYLMTWTRGHPLYAIELLRTLELAEILEQSDTGWRLNALSNIPVPSLVQQMVERRMSALSTTAYSALQVAAVFGQEIPLAYWQLLTGAETVATAAVEAIDLMLVAESATGDAVTFRHALIRETVYNSLSMIQRRLLHRQIAEALIDRPDADPDAVAYHLQRAGDPRAAEWLLRSGERAERSYSWLEAVDRYLSAIDAMQQHVEIRGREAGPTLRIGQLLRFADPGRAAEFLQRAYQRAIDEGEDGLAMHTLFHIGQMDCASGEVQRGLRNMQIAVDGLATGKHDTEEMRRWALQLLPGEARTYPLEIINGTMAVWLATYGRFTEAISAAERYLDVDWRRAGSREPLDSVLDQTVGNHDAFHALGIALAAVGRPEESHIAFELVSEHLRRLNVPPMIILTSFTELTSLVYPFAATDTAYRRQVLERLSAACRRLDESWRSSETWMWESQLYYEGRWDRLQEIIDATPLSTATLIIPGVLFRDIAIRTRARFAWRRGERDVARELIEGMFPDGPDTEPGERFLQCATDVQRLAAEMALEEGAIERARRWLTAHDRWIEWSDSTVGRAEGLLLWARFHMASSEIERSYWLAQRALEQAKTPEQPLALIEAHRFLGMLALQSQEYERSAAHLMTSEELASASGAPFERALTNLEQARLDVDRGNRNDAADRLAEVRRVCEQLGAAPTLAQAEALKTRVQHRRPDTLFGLSPREMEVLGLMAQGMSDRQIADELFISLNTVIRHAASVRRKLDVDSRAGAVAVAIRNQLI